MVFVGGGDGEHDGPRELHPFAIEDRTPRTFRVPTVADDDADAPDVLAGVAEVVLAVSDLDAAVEEFRRAYRFPTPARWTDDGFGARLASFPGKPVTLAEPGQESWLADRLDEVGAGPCAYLFGTDDLDAARDAYALSSPTVWGGSRADARRLAWVDADVLGTTVGVVAVE
jgi:hypothetical protein